jgi:cyclohexadienyl dehydratase
VGTTCDYKLFSFRNSDERYAGADIVMAQSLVQELNVKLEFVATTWGKPLPDFGAQRCDVALGGVSVLPDPATRGNFSTTIGADGKRLITHSADNPHHEH